MPYVDTSRGSDHALAKLAARTNAEWCDLFCQSHGVVGTFHPDAWASVRRTPPLYPDAVALDRSISGERILSYVDDSAGCSIKDSFAAMELAAAGFRILFEAEWVYRPSSMPTSPVTGLRWERTRDIKTLSQWERAWNSLVEPTGFFPPVLLGHPAVLILAGYAGHELIAGAIVNGSASSVGLSNVFSRPDDLNDTYADIVAATANYFPGFAIVGYESGKALVAARAQGFRSVGPLRVWLKD